nr:D-aminoacylase [Candidatus Njordarchaeum guaymaensis]
MIRDGRILDGTGNPWFRADVGIRAGKISFLGHIAGQTESSRLISARGLIVCPGFVDIHSHSDRTLIFQSKATSSLLQGITTQAIGNCGSSMAPITAKNRHQMVRRLTAGGDRKVRVSWKTMGGYLARLRRQGIGENVAPFVGHGTIRSAVLRPEGEGGEKVDLSEREIRRMESLLDRAMHEGAMGLSTGLAYPPGRNATTEEIVRLCKVVAKRDGVYLTHIRNEGDYVVEAVREAIVINEGSAVPVNIAHHKAWGKKNWGKVRKTLKLMEEARKRGSEIACDVYPYDRAGVSLLLRRIFAPERDVDLKQLLRRLADPHQFEVIKEEVVKRVAAERQKANQRRKKLRRRGVASPRFEMPGTAVVVYSKSRPDLLGKNLKEISRLAKRDWITAARDLVVADRGETKMAGYMSEEDVEMVIASPISMVSTDCSSYETPPDERTTATHPRTYGTYPRLLARYVKERNILSLAQAIRKITSYPATVLKQRDRGLMRPGMWADIVIFDEHRICDRSTFAQPTLPPQGIVYVIVNGKIAVDRGAPTGVLAGKILNLKAAS